MTEKKQPNLKRLHTPQLPDTFKVLEIDNSAALPAETDPKTGEPMEDPDSIDWTAKQEEGFDISKYDQMCEIFVDRIPHLKKTLDACWDYKNGHMHYIIRSINSSAASEYENKKYVVELYCNADKNVQKRTRKLARRYHPGREIVFYNLHT